MQKSSSQAGTRDLEFWDILRADRTKTGRTKLRGEALGPEEFHLAVHVWIRSPSNAYLISRRALDKQPFPGAWEPSGGAVQAGETSLEAALREVEEELGLSLPRNEGRLVAQLNGEGKHSQTLSDVWLFEFDFSPRQVSIQATEVADVMVADSKQISTLIAEGKFVPYVARYWPALAAISNRAGSPTRRAASTSGQSGGNP
ncbi:MAG: NUDIX domain-containing protein [Spirochaetales bacterium]